MKINCSLPSSSSLGWPGPFEEAGVDCAKKYKRDRICDHCEKSDRASFFKQKEVEMD